MYTPGIGAPSFGSTFLHQGPRALPVAIQTYSNAEPKVALNCVDAKVTSAGLQNTVCCPGYLATTKSHRDPELDALSDSFFVAR